MSSSDDVVEKLQWFLSTQDAAEPTATPLPVPRKLGRYTLLEVVGEGGMGVVFRARDEELGREVALKMLKTVHSYSASQVERFLREERLTARLNHPGIVTVYDVGRESDAVFYAMEFVPGLPFDPRRGELHDRVAVLEKVARAVHHAHEQGVIHRDLKPGNILVDPQGNPHLLDFGLSRDLLADSDLTRTGAVFGTPHYMSPEQAEGRGRDIDARADVYALGTILYEVLNGTVPFRGNTMPEVARQLTGATPTPPAGPRDLATCCLKAMEKRPEDRYPTAGAFADDLARALSGRPVDARRKLPLGRIAAVLVLLAALALAGWRATRPPEPPPSLPPLEPGVVGEYFQVTPPVEDVMTSARKPVLRRIDRRLFFKLGAHGFIDENTLADHVFVRWSGVLRAPTDGRYGFRLVSDDGSRLYIDGRIVVDNGGIHGRREQVGDAVLKAGDHDFRLEFYEGVGELVLIAEWEPPGRAREILTDADLFHRPDNK